MRYRNTENSYVPIGPRESVPPFGLTRDFTKDELEKNIDLRHALTQNYLVEWDGKDPLPAESKPKAKKAIQYTTAPDTQGGDVTRKKTKSGTVVEYITATDVGVDGVENANLEDGLIASVEGRKPVDYIEEGVVAPKPQWRNASDAFEAELKDETTQDPEFDDNQTLADNEADREEAPDAEDAIAGDFSQIVKQHGNMGATVTSVKDAVLSDASAANAELAQATSGAQSAKYDNGETADGVSKEAAEFLAQPFSAKKWLISKTSDSNLLKEVSSSTKSDSVRSLANQRLSEIEKQ